MPTPTPWWFGEVSFLVRAAYATMEERGRCLTSRRSSARRCSLCSDVTRETSADSLSATRQQVEEQSRPGQARPHGWREKAREVDAHVLRDFNDEELARLLDLL